MGLLNRKGVPLRQRLRTSWWTSVGVGVLVLLGHAGRRWTSEGAAEDARGPGSAPEAPPRRLDGGGSNIEDKYPADLVLSKPYRDDPNQWLVFLHVIGIGYMLLGLNTVCDVYFTGALEEMVENWEVQDDVAGATFMAAGGSAPEFFTSLIGTTIVENDVGFGTIVGSAVFNVLFVIGLCGWVAPTAMELSWWPLFRDCSYYVFGLSLLAAFASDGTIQLIEAGLLFAAYLVYVTIMYHNEKLEGLAQRVVGKKVVTPSLEESDKPGEASARAQASPDKPMPPRQVSPSPEAMAVPPSPKLAPDLAEYISKGDGGLKVTTVGWEDLENALGPPPSLQAVPDQTPEATPDAVDVPNKQEEQKDGKDNAEGPGAQRRWDPLRGFVDDDDDDDDDAPFIQRPEGVVNQMIWAVSLPVYVPLWFLTPQPSAEKACNGALPVPVFLCTFIVSLSWISIFAFLLVWWVEVVGEILRVNEIVMGFTILAAGTSIPDAVSSMAVARHGHGDMAVSSSIGSNIFDILVGLPVPWIIKIGIIERGGFELEFLSPFLAFYVILLLGMVLCTILAIHFMGWRLNKMLGLAMAALYVVFLAVAMIVEVTEPDSLMVKH